MARHKDANWTLPDRAANWTQVNTALLMDLRDELQAVHAALDKLNALLHCQNFQQIPSVLRGIRRKIPTRTRRRKS